MGQWVGAQGRPKVAKISKTSCFLWRHLQKSPHWKQQTFFSILSTRLAESMDGLDSFLAQSPGEL